VVPSFLCSYPCVRIVFCDRQRKPAFLCLPPAEPAVVLSATPPSNDLGSHGRRHRDRTHSQAAQELFAIRVESHFRMRSIFGRTQIVSRQRMAFGVQLLRQLGHWLKHFPVRLTLPAQGKAWSVFRRSLVIFS
jgi:hypothetical protein